MGPRETVVRASPEAVWAVLSDPFRYDDWVVGTREIREADETWPAVGSRLHHTVGVPPLLVHDVTEVLESEPQRRLVLQAKLRPAGVLKVDIRLRPEGANTRVQMQEHVVGGPLRLTGPLGDVGAQARMEVGLRRLRRLVER